MVGMRHIADAGPGPVGSDPEELAFHDGFVLFSGDRADVGRELFAVPVPLFVDGFEWGDTSAWQ